ncbi:cardiolipin synthase [Scopulibacillus daqui]|uniref:Cardiolipin synthase n=1 Tax=Scopulibacillus daqui TaxID=1469162 RepID=A0ABS2Q1I9_9BACL|nr:cardiolipin synthase [Scopulibacillus daqui]MBM7646158.1 cardiolipin synthase [Scopulibacillus daqui]
MSLVISILFTLILILNISLAAAIIFLERRNIASTWSWLMVLVFIPIAGFIIYLIFGRNLSKKKIFHLSSKEIDEIQETIQKQENELRHELVHYNDPVMVDYEEMIYMNLNKGHSTFTQDNHIEIFTDGRKKFEALFESLEQAREHIHLQYYIIRNDDLGKKLVNILTKKANEGVKVRVLCDDWGTRVPRRFFKDLRAAGGEVAAFFPSKIPYLNFKLNNRNHRKIVVIDGICGFLGGFNVGEEYLGLRKKFGYWRDTHLKICGSAVHLLQSRFFLDWNNASHQHLLQFDEKYFPNILEPKGKAGMQIVSSGPDSKWQQIKNGFISMIHLAKESVYIQTPYFIPSDSVMNALLIAALSGVDVRIMIPNKPDHIFVYWASLSHIGELLDAGVKCYIYNEGFIHAKTIVVDGKIASVGTANIDIRSLKLNFETTAFIYDSQVSLELKKTFEQDLKKCWELTPEIYKQRPRRVKFKESISRLLSPIL